MVIDVRMSASTDLMHANLDGLTGTVSPALGASTESDTGGCDPRTVSTTDPPAFRTSNSDADGLHADEK
jgi:hypothetical protein